MSIPAPGTPPHYRFRRVSAKKELEEDDWEPPADGVLPARQRIPQQQIGPNGIKISRDLDKQRHKAGQSELLKEAQAQSDLGPVPGLRAPALLQLGQIAPPDLGTVFQEPLMTAPNMRIKPPAAGEAPLQQGPSFQGPMGASSVPHPLPIRLQDPPSTSASTSSLQGMVMRAASTGSVPQMKGPSWAMPVGAGLRTPTTPAPLIAQRSTSQPTPSSPQQFMRLTGHVAANSYCGTPSTPLMSGRTSPLGPPSRPVQPVVTSHSYAPAPSLSTSPCLGSKVILSPQHPAVAGAAFLSPSPSLEALSRPSFSFSPAAAGWVRGLPARPEQRPVLAPEAVQGGLTQRTTQFSPAWSSASTGSRAPRALDTKGGWPQPSMPLSGGSVPFTHRPPHVVEGPKLAPPVSSRYPSSAQQRPSRPVGVDKEAVLSRLLTAPKPATPPDDFRCCQPLAPQTPPAKSAASSAADASKRKRVLVTGATGLLGREVMRLLGDGSWEVVGLAKTRARPPQVLACDLLDEDAVTQQIMAFEPDVVMHLASERRSEVIRRDPAAARRLNVDATGTVAAACSQIGAWMIFISADAIFDGRSPAYFPDSKPNPLGDFGWQKLSAEQLALAANPRTAVLRLSLLYGPVDFVEESSVTGLIAGLQQGVREVDCWQLCYPTFTTDVAGVLRFMLELHCRGGELRGIYHWQGLEQLSWHQMLMIVAEASGHDARDIRPVATAPPIPMPWDCRLDCSRLQRLLEQRKFHTPFREGVASSLRKLGLKPKVMEVVDAPSLLRSPVPDRTATEAVELRSPLHKADPRGLLAGGKDLPEASDAEAAFHEELKKRGAALQELFWQELERTRNRLRQAGIVNHGRVFSDNSPLQRTREGGLRPEQQKLCLEALAPLKASKAGQFGFQAEQRA